MDELDPLELVAPDSVDPLEPPESEPLLPESEDALLDSEELSEPVAGASFLSVPVEALRLDERLSVL